MKHTLALLAFLTIQALSAPEFHVAPSGNDANDGSAQSPFATLEAARDAIRAKGAAKGATVHLHAGRYLREQPFILEPQDSGSKEHPVIYQAARGEIPVIDGSRQITGWKNLTDKRPDITPAAKGKLWVADTEPGWKFGFLYINDRPAQRARWINDNRWRDWPKNHKPGKSDRAGQLITFEGDASVLTHLPSNGDAEMHCILAQFGIMGNGVITAVDPAAGTLRWNSKQLNVAIPRHLHEVGYNFENAVSLIDEPGEWAVDTALGKVYYWPLQNENLTTAEIRAPKAYRLLLLQGAGESGPYVHHIEFRGITFQNTDRLPEDRWPADFLIRQWENVDATVYLQGTHDCAFTGNRILRSGAYGMTLKHHSQRNRIEANEIGWTGSGGIFLEGFGPGTLDVNRENVIVRNHLHDHGLANYWHSPCIQIFQSGHNRITHNLLQRSAYSAISTVGMGFWHMDSPSHMLPGTWSGQVHEWAKCQPRLQDFPDETIAAVKARTQRFDRDTMKPYIHSNANLLEKNVIVNPHTLLNEGGAIYAWSTGKDNIWRENLIFVNHAMPGSSVLALDDLTEYFRVEKNVFWVHGIILNGVGNRKTERGNIIQDNHRVMFRAGHAARVKHGLGTWWHDHEGREPFDTLFATIKAEVDAKGGWPGNPAVGLPGIDPAAKLGGEQEMVVPKNAPVTIQE
jgi:hypothetical protein